MTDREIKKNAEKYAIENYGEYDEHDYTDHSGSNMCHAISEKAFIAGAHSRDEEVKEWIESKGKLRRKLMHMIYDLRHPWISVEDMLPEKTKGIFSCQVRQLEEDKIVYYKDTRGYIHTGYLNATNH